MMWLSMAQATPNQEHGGSSVPQPSDRVHWSLLVALYSSSSAEWSMKAAALREASKGTTAQIDFMLGVNSGWAWPRSRG